MFALLFDLPHFRFCQVSCPVVGQFEDITCFVGFTIALCVLVGQEDVQTQEIGARIAMTMMSRSNG